MAKALLICTELSAEELRRRSREEDDRRAALRMLAIANALDGMTRPQAARLADMERQALTDTIKRYNARGLDGLYDAERSGRPPKLGDAQREELRQIVLAGPDVETEGLSAYTRDDIARIIGQKWQITYDPTSVGRILRGLGFSRQKTRPSHPKKDPAAAEALKKGSRDPAETCRYI